MRVLHIGNVANNAYNNAKIQRAHGIEADVASYDYYHVMGTPEWEDAEIVGDLVDPFFPDWWNVDLGGFQRPRWFAQGRATTVCRYLLARRAGDRLLCRLLWRALGLDRWLRSRSTRAARVVNGVLRPYHRVQLAMLYAPVTSRRAKLRGVLRRRTSPPSLSPRARSGDSGPAPAGAGDGTLPALFAERFPSRTDRLDRLDLTPYMRALPLWCRLLPHYDVVQCYATDPIIPLLCGRREYAAYEHGTLRETPFADEPSGRVAALGYREAPVVFVTNSDVLPSAERLGIPESAIVCLPHAVDSDRLIRYARDHAHLAPRADGEVTFFAPSRQDWVDAHPSWTKGNDQMIRALRIAVDRGLACRLVLGDWGRDVDASRRLIAELELNDVVDWTPPRSKRRLWDAMLGAHAVLDQFVLPAIGGVTFEAMALGRRVLTRLDEPAAAAFFGAEVPVLACHGPSQIADAMATVARDPGDETGLGGRAQRWFAQYHSAERIVALQAGAYQRLVGMAE